MKKNLLLITDSFPRWEGDVGSSLQMLDFASVMTRKFNVFVLTPHQNCCAAFEKLNEINVIRHKYLYPKWESICSGAGFMENMKKKASAKLLFPFFAVSEFISVIKTVKRYNIDLINAHGLFPHGIIVSVVKKFIKIPHILSIADTSFVYLSKFDYLGNYLIKFTLRNSDKVVAACVYIRYLLEKIAGNSFANSIIPIGIDAERFVLPKEKKNLRKNLDIAKHEKIFLFEDRLIEKSGIQYLLESAKLLKADKVEFKLLIIGTGNMEPDLRKWIKTNSMENNVKLISETANSLIYDYYTIADAVVVPFTQDVYGDIDGLPVALMNAFAAGIPVIASKTGGASDIIKDYHNGWLFENKNYYDLYSKMKLIFNSPYLDSVKANMQSSADTFNIELIAEKYCGLFDEYIGLKK